MVKRGSLFFLENPYERNGCSRLSCDAPVEATMVCGTDGCWNRYCEADGEYDRAHGIMRCRQCQGLD